MKKLTIITSILMAAASTYAASLTWTSDNPFSGTDLVTPDGSIMMKDIHPYFFGLYDDAGFTLVSPQLDSLLDVAPGAPPIDNRSFTSTEVLNNGDFFPLLNPDVNYPDYATTGTTLHTIIFDRDPATIVGSALDYSYIVMPGTYSVAPNQSPEPQTLGPYTIGTIPSGNAWTTVNVPEPSTFALIGLGLAGMLYRRHRK